MKTNFFIFSMLFVLLISCNAYQNVNTQDVSMGMSKKEVFGIINGEPVLEHSDSSVEIYSVQKRIVRAGIAEYPKYFFYFENNKLDRIDRGERAVDYRIKIDTN